MSQKIDIGDLYKKTTLEDSVDPGDALWDNLSASLQQEPSGLWGRMIGSKSTGLKLFYGITAASIIGVSSYLIMTNSTIDKTFTSTPVAPQPKDTIHPSFIEENSSVPLTKQSSSSVEYPDKKISSTSTAITEDTIQALSPEIQSKIVDSVSSPNQVTITAPKKKTPVVIVKKDTIYHPDTIAYKNKRSLKKIMKKEEKEKSKE